MLEQRALHLTPAPSGGAAPWRPHTTTPGEPWAARPAAGLHPEPKHPSALSVCFPGGQGQLPAPGGSSRLAWALLGSVSAAPFPSFSPHSSAGPRGCRHVVGRGRQLRAQGRRGGEGAEAAAEALLCLPRHQKGEGCLVSALPGPWGFPSGSPGCAGGVGASRHGCEEGGAGLVARPKGRLPEEVLKLLKLLHSCWLAEEECQSLLMLLLPSSERCFFNKATLSVCLQSSQSCKHRQ